MTLVEELENLEEKLWQKEYRFSLEWMDSVLADDFFEYGRSGRIYSREECLKALPQEIKAKFPLENLDIRKIYSDVYQATYKSMVIYEGIAEYANRSSIWLKTDSGWKLKFHQGTPLE